MGEGKMFRCSECGYKYSARFGTGENFPEVYRETVSEVRRGAYGQDWKELFEHTPGAALNAEAELYVCPSCGCFENMPDLSVYVPKGPEEMRGYQYSSSDFNPGADVVTSEDLARNYRCLYVFWHGCPECGQRMRRCTGDDRLKCPECSEGRLSPTGLFLWR